MKLFNSIQGKCHRDRNYLGELEKQCLPYRYCTLLGLKDTHFGVLLKFENFVAYISKVSLKSYINYSSIPNNEAMEYLKKAVKLPIVRQFVKKVNYTYSVYEVYKLGSAMSSKSTFARRFIKRYSDIIDVLKLSKVFQDVYLRVRVYDTNDKCFSEDCVVHQGDIIL